MVQQAVAAITANTTLYSTPLTSYDEAIARARGFKRYVEDSDGYKLLNSQGVKKPFSREQDVQLFFGLIFFADEFDVNREVNNGRGGVGGEHVSHPAVLVDDGAEVVVHGRAGPAGLAPLGLAERAEPAIARRDPPRGPVRHRLTVVAGLVSEQPMPELAVVLVGVEQRVRAIRLHHLACGAAGSAPAWHAGVGAGP